MKSLILLERLKLLWLGFEIVKHFISRKREKAMIEALEKLNHRLNLLEDKAKEIPSFTPVRGGIAVLHSVFNINSQEITS